MSQLTRISAGCYRHDRLGVALEKTATPGMPWQLAGPDPDGSSVVHARTLGDARAFLCEIDQRLDAAPDDSWARRALLGLHRHLFPERYEDVEMYEWHAGTIEEVAAMLELALAGEPRARLSPK